MRRLLFAIVLFAAPCLTGCSMYDLMFGVFGNHYTDAGTTETEKRWDYGDKVRSYGGDAF
jgi:hypothetical protein